MRYSGSKRRGERSERKLSAKVRSAQLLAVSRRLATQSDELVRYSSGVRLRLSQMQQSLINSFCAGNPGRDMATTALGESAEQR